MSYRITREIQSRAFHSFSYEAEELNGGEPTGAKRFVKTPLVEAETPTEIRKRVKEIYQTFEQEYEKRDRLKDITDVSRYIAMGRTRVRFNQVDYGLPFLVQEYIDGKMLDDYFGTRRPGDGVFSGLHSVAEWFWMARRIVSVLRRVHNQQIVHGDISPRNILIVEKDLSNVPTEDRDIFHNQKTAPFPCIVDFGQSFLADQDQNRLGAPTKKIKPYRAPERDRAYLWRLPADIYSAGAVLYFLAAGEDPPQSIKKARNVSELKRIIRERLGERNLGLLRANEGIATILDKCLRNNPHDRYFCAEHIVADLETFRHKSTPSIIGGASSRDAGAASDASPSNGTQVDRAFDGLVAVVRRNALETRNPFFEAIILKHLDMLAKHSDSMKRDHFEIYGDRDEIIDHLCRYISTLRSGDEYVTVTQPSYWKKNNLGINGRFFTMNKIMARRGVRIRRVFLLTPAERSRKEETAILRAHMEAAADLVRQNVSIKKSGEKPDQGVFYAGFLMKTPKERHDYFERQGHHVGIWRKADGTMMSLIFSTRPVGEESANASGDQIVKVRFWVSPSLQGPYDQLKDIVGRSQAINKLFD